MHGSEYTGRGTTASGWICLIICQIKISMNGVLGTEQEGIGVYLETKRH